MSKQRIHSQAGFTLIEVGIASLVLVVGFIGMIRAMTFTSGLMDHARRQTVAAQILTNEIEQLRLRDWSTISNLSTSATVMTWSAAATYAVSDLVSSSGTWYRCIAAAPAGQTPPNATYWTTYTGPITNTGIVNGATYSVSRSVADLVSGTLREVTFTVTWTVVSGRRNADNTPLIFSYSRVNSAFFGKNGLNLSYQRS